MASIIRTDALQNLNTSNIISQTNATTITVGAAGQTVAMPGSVNLPTGSVGISQLSATGTPTSSNFLRGDNTWNAPQAGFSGSTTTSSAVDITLTSSSTQVQNVEMTAADKAVILPDATTLTTKGSPIFVINNSGANAFNVKNNSGFSLFVLNPLSSIMLSLVDNSTSSGKWSSEDAVNVLSWLDYTTVNTTNGLTMPGYSNNNSFHGITISAINSTSAVISYQKGTSNRDVYARVISYSGSTITANSETILYNGSSTSAQNNFILMLSTTAGFLFVSRTSNMIVVPFTVSGTTITVGTASSTFGVGPTGDQSQLGNAVAMTATEALLCERSSTSASTFTFRNIIHNGASAPTIGTASSAITTSGVDMFPIHTPATSTTAFFNYVASGVLNGRVVTISGSSAPTLGTANTSSGIDNSSNGCGIFRPYKVSSTEFITLGATHSVNYTISGTTVTHVSNKSFSTNTSFGIAGGNGTQVGDYLVGTQITTGYGFIYVFKKVGSHLQPLTYTTTPATTINIGKSFNVYAGISSACFLTNLDSTTFVGLTNNLNDGNVYLTIVKINL